MSEIVVAGCSDCPYFAKVELLADMAMINLPNFHVHKIVKSREDWSTWVHELSITNNWNVSNSPIVWRELVDRGGKGHLIGDANDFQEYIKCYYGLSSNFTSEQLHEIAKDNITFLEEHELETCQYKSLSRPTKICISGAANDAVPHFITGLANGDIIDRSTELSIVFLDKAENMTYLKSLQMGTFDLAATLVRSISITEDTEAAFADSAYVIIFDEITQLPLESLETWLKRCQEHYEYLGNVIEKYCSTEVKVVLVPDRSTNLININLTCIHRMLNRVQKFNVVGLSRPFEQHARSIVAKQLSVNPSNVHSIIVWGNIGGKKLFDISNCRVHKYDGSIVGPEPFSLPSVKTIWDKRWMRNEMENLIHQRFDKISELRSSSGSPLAVANALSTFMRQWINGDERGHIHSLVVASEGRYGVPEGMLFSMPVTLNPAGYWAVVQDAELSEEQFKRINECIQDVNEQLMIIYPWMNNNKADVVLDEAFIDSQIYALMEEVYPKERLGQLRSLLNDSLSVEDKLDVSKSKELLLRTISDLERPEKPINSEPVTDITTEGVVATTDTAEENNEIEDDIKDSSEAEDEEDEEEEAEDK